MATNLKQKRISPAALYSLKEALANIFWYKPDLKSFIMQSISNTKIISRLNWDDYKWKIVGTLIDIMSLDQDTYQDDLISLMINTSKIENFSHLESLKDGSKLVAKASQAVAGLKSQIGSLEQLVVEREKILKRRTENQEKIVKAKDFDDKLEEYKVAFITMFSSEEPQKRGYLLEKLLYDLFKLYDLDPRASFKNTGEQIDGAFTFDHTDYILEAKWESSPVQLTKIDTLSGKVRRKLENTLGVFVAINGYSPECIKGAMGGINNVILIDGSDLYAVLEGRITLDRMLLRKRQAAADTGNIYLKIADCL